MGERTQLQGVAAGKTWRDQHFGARPTVSCETVAKMSPGLGTDWLFTAAPHQGAAPVVDQGVGNVALRTSIA